MSVDTRDPNAVKESTERVREKLDAALAAIPASAHEQRVERNSPQDDERAAFERRQAEGRELGFARIRDRHCFSERCKKSDAGVWLCKECEAVLGAKDVVLCEKCVVIARQKQEQKRGQDEAAKLDRLFENFSKGNGSNVACRSPNWQWARFSNQEFRRRVSKKLLDGVEGSEFKQNVVLSAPTGKGKTALVWAELVRMLEVQKAKALAGEKAFATRFAWFTGPEVAGSRRRSRIGEESPIVELATSVQLLVLDELGFEPSSEEIFFVLDHRYRASLPTVVTTGLSWTEFKARYGDALARRLIDPGKLLEVKA